MVILVLHKYFWGYLFSGRKACRNLCIRQDNTQLVNMGACTWSIWPYKEKFGTLQQGCLLCALSPVLQCYMQDCSTVFMWPLETHLKKKSFKSFFLSFGGIQSFSNPCNLIKLIRPESLQLWGIKSEVFC